MLNINKNWFQRCTAGFLVMAIFSTQPLSTLAQENINNTISIENIDATELVYWNMMDKLEKIEKGKIDLNSEEIDIFNQVYEVFLENQEAILGNLGYDSETITEQLNVLRQRKENSFNPLPVENSDEVPTVNTPENPSNFSFKKDPAEIETILREELSAKVDILTKFTQLFTIQSAKALSTNVMPVLADLQADSEVIIDLEIKKLAESLNHNPVEIYNFVRKNIKFEPYFGAKKGSIGCLRDKICNDVDTSSLTIALLRASEIPARYKKEVAHISIESLKKLLGVDEARTIFAAFTKNDVPIYVINGTSQVGTNLDTYNFSGQTHFALEWVHPEIFFEYDEKGGNIGNILTLSDSQDDNALRSTLSNHPAKQWIPIDTVLTSEYTRTKKDILVDSASFNTENFWKDFFKYQGGGSPLTKYKSDLKTATNKDIKDYLSNNNLNPNDLHELPPTLSYNTGTGTLPGGTTITTETFTSLPAKLKPQVTISVLKESDKSVLLSKTFNASEINNVDLTLKYVGATAQDETTIKTYGGLYGTPLNLIKIVPVFEGEKFTEKGTSSFDVGTKLITQIKYVVGGNTIDTKEKFSTAGDRESILIALSRIYDNGSDDDQDIMRRGGAAIARKFLLKVQEDTDTLSDSLDFEYDVQISHAIVSQGRYLKLDSQTGKATKFDFRGVAIDAGTLITDYSRRGNYKTHQKDFRLIFGQNASFHEGDIFDSIAAVKGISTTKGLQYAYANPSTYTVYTIDSNNISIIDTLGFSTNTKNNMKADVNNGNTILTPDKPVTADQWKGIFYVSLGSDWAGQYAIGEQVSQNGGFTTVNFNLLNSCNVNSPPTAPMCSMAAKTNISSKFDGQQQPGQLIYNEEKDPNTYGTLSFCKQSDAKLTTLSQSYAGWKVEYGDICAEFKNQFGSYDHNYAVAPHAVYFFSPNHYAGHWVTSDSAYNVLIRDEAIQNTSNYTLNNPTLRGKFKFNWVAGTFSKYGNYGIVFKDYLTGYYSPASAKAYTVFQDALEIMTQPTYETPSLCPVNTLGCGWVLNAVGFPLGTLKEIRSDASNGATQGYVQKFANGEVFIKRNEDETGLKATYTLQSLHDHYNASANCLGTGKCGVEGKFGYPVSEPILEIPSGNRVQVFENGDEVRCTSASGGCSVTKSLYEVKVDTRFTQVGNYHIHFLEGMADAAIEVGLVDKVFYETLFALGENYTEAVVEKLLKLGTGILTAAASKGLIKKATKRTLLKAIPYIGWGIIAYDAIKFVFTHQVLNTKCIIGTGTRNVEEQAYMCGKLTLTMIAEFAIGGVKNVVADGSMRVVGHSASKYKIFKTVSGAELEKEIKENYISKLVETLKKSEGGDFLVLFAGLDGPSFSWLFENTALYERLAGDSDHFYSALDLLNIDSTNIYNSPGDSFFEPNEAGLKIKVKGEGADKIKLVRIHGDTNAYEPYFMNEKDVPGINDGKIDKDELAKMLKVSSSSLTKVSRYKPHTGDELIEGPLKDYPYVSYFKLRNWQSLSNTEKVNRIEFDDPLTKKL